MSETRLTEAQYDAITEAAAQWCMRLHEPDCTDQEREAFTVWLNADPLHAFEYQAMQDIWEISEHLPKPEPVTPQVIARPQRSRQPAWRKLAIAAAITLLAVPVAAYSGWELGWVPNAYERVQAHAQLQTVILPDGSEVELNLGTELTYANYKDQRRVTLSKGEAFFKVSHDVTHPFVVQAAEGRVRVTGTQFNVWMYQDQVKVTLLEGSVLVTSNKKLSGDGLRLEPGMQARYKAGDYAPQIGPDLRQLAGSGVAQRQVGAGQPDPGRSAAPDQPLPEYAAGTGRQCHRRPARGWRVQHHRNQQPRDFPSQSVTGLPDPESGW